MANTKSVKAMIEERAILLTKLQQMHDKAEGRDLDEQESQTWRKLEKAVTELTIQIRDAKIEEMKAAIESDPSGDHSHLSNEMPLGKGSKFYYPGQ